MFHTMPLLHEELVRYDFIIHINPMTDTKIIEK